MPRYAKICPRCKSLNVAIEHQGSLSGLTALGLPTVYRCRACGFTNAFFPEIEVAQPEKNEKVKAKKGVYRKSSRVTE